MFLILEIRLKTYDIKNLIRLNIILTKIFNNNVLIGPILTKKKIKKFCILRSPFKHKDSREQFEIKLFSETLFFKLKSKQRIFLFIYLLLNNLPADFSKNIYFNIRIKNFIK